MKIKDIFHELLYDGDKLTFTFDRKDRDQIISKLESLGEIDHNAEYDVQIKKIRHKRSKDANSYMWVLADKIARKLHTSKEEVYKDAIRRRGVFKDVSLDSEAVEMLICNWSDKGIGWFAEPFSSFGDSETVRLYFGSSTYNTEEMSDLIDDIVEEAQNLGIETDTPDEIEHMKAMWGGNAA